MNVARTIIMDFLRHTKPPYGLRLGEGENARERIQRLVNEWGPDAGPFFVEVDHDDGCPCHDTDTPLERCECRSLLVFFTWAKDPNEGPSEGSKPLDRLSLRADTESDNLNERTSA